MSGDEHLENPFSRFARAVARAMFAEMVDHQRKEAAAGVRLPAPPHIEVLLENLPNRPPPAGELGSTGDQPASAPTHSD